MGRGRRGPVGYEVACLFDSGRELRCPIRRYCRRPDRLNPTRGVDIFCSLDGTFELSKGNLDLSHFETAAVYVEARVEGTDGGRLADGLDDGSGALDHQPAHQSVKGSLLEVRPSGDLRAVFHQF